MRAYRDLIWDWSTYLYRGGHWQLYAELLQCDCKRASNSAIVMGKAATYTNLGNLARNQGRYAEAAEYYAQSLAIARELGDHAGESWTLGNLGNLARGQGRYAEAAEYYTQSLPSPVNWGTAHGEGHALRA